MKVKYFSVKWSDVLTEEFTTIHRSNTHGLFGQRRVRQQDTFWGTLLICPDLLLKAVFDRWGYFPFGQVRLIGTARSSPWDEVWEKSINLKLLQVEGPLTRSLQANTPKRTLTGSISWLLCISLDPSICWLDHHHAGFRHLAVTKPRAELDIVLYWSLKYSIITTFGLTKAPIYILYYNIINII